MKNTLCIIACTLLLSGFTNVYAAETDQGRDTQEWSGSIDGIPSVENGSLHERRKDAEKH